MVNIVAQYPELMRLVYVAGFELPGAERMFREHLGSIFDAVNAYFGAASISGAICNLEPTFATLGLAAAVSAHRNFHSLVTGRDSPWDAQALTPGYTQFWLNAMRQSPAPRPGCGFRTSVGLTDAYVRCVAGCINHADFGEAL